ncbi:unnamed protein product [Lampetra planeri]
MGNRDEKTTGGKDVEGCGNHGAHTRHDHQGNRYTQATVHANTEIAGDADTQTARDGGGSSPRPKLGAHSIRGAGGSNRRDSARPGRSVAAPSRSVFSPPARVTSRPPLA